MIVVDTSVLVDYFRGKETPATALLDRLELDDVPFAVPDIGCQELLAGARNEREWGLLKEYLLSQRLLRPADSVAAHVEAARIFFDARRKGVTLRGPVDCYIAELVLEGKHTLLHDDEDFERIKSVRPLRTLRG